MTDLNLISSDNYISVNISIINILGLKHAVYISEILSIYNKAQRKNAIEDNYFCIDRDYIQKRTSITKDSQKKIDEELKLLGILEVKDDNIIKFNIDTLTKTINKNEDKKISVRNGQIKKQVKESQDEKCKKAIRCKNEELRKAWYEWIDEMMSKFQYIGVKQTLKNQEILDNFCNHNLDLALKILDIATTNGWKDIQKVLDLYKNKLVTQQDITYNKNEVELGDEF